MEPVTTAVLSQLAMGVLRDLVRDAYRPVLNKVYQTVGIDKNDSFNVAIMPLYTKIIGIQNSLDKIKEHLQRTHLAKLKSGINQVQVATTLLDNKNGVLSNALQDLSYVENLAENGMCGDISYKEIRTLATLGIAGIYSEWGNKDLAIGQIIKACVSDRSVAAGIGIPEILQKINKEKVGNRCFLSIETLNIPDIRPFSRITGNYLLRAEENHLKTWAIGHQKNKCWFEVVGKNKITLDFESEISTDSITGLKSAAFSFVKKNPVTAVLGAYCAPGMIMASALLPDQSAKLAKQLSTKRFTHSSNSISVRLEACNEYVFKATAKINYRPTSILEFSDLSARIIGVELEHIETINNAQIDW